jgi:outer membrane protein insertion porin family
MQRGQHPTPGASRAGRGSPALGASGFIIAAFLAFFLALPAPAEAQTYRFTAIQVDGNVLSDDATVIGLMGIARGQTVSAGDLNAAYQALMRSGIYESVDLTPRGNTLAVQVREYPIINRIAFQGNRRIGDDILAQVITSQVRRVYSPATAEADAREIAALYAQAGRLGAEVTPRLIDRGAGRVDLVFEVREGRVVEVERLSFVGNRAFSDRRLRQVLQTAQAGLLRTFVQRDTYDEARIALDRQLLTDFYRSRGYIDFEVLSVTPELTRERDAFFVTFTVREGLPYRIARATVASEIPGIDTAAFERQLRLRPGVLYSPSVIEANIQRLEFEAATQGRRFVRVEPRITRNEAAQTLDVAFTLVQGERLVIERIEITGNSTTLDRVIRRQFRVVEGDPLDPREVRAAAERIRALGFFSRANVQPRPGTGPGLAIVDVEVEEAPTGSLGFGVAYGVNAGVGFSLTFSEANFLGRGQRLDLVLNTARGSRELRFGFGEPAFLGRDLRFNVDSFYRTTTQQFARFDSTTFDFTMSLSFPVSRFGRLEPRYRLGFFEMTNLTSASAPLQADFAEGQVFTSAVGATYTLDTRRRGSDPNQGVILRFGADLAGLGGDRQYIASTVLAGYERRFRNGDITLRAEVEAGALTMIDGLSRVNERYTLSNRMRGFEPNGIGPYDSVTDDFVGGTYFAVARFEAGFPIGLPTEYGISGGVFWDVGSLWGLDGGYGDVDSAAYMRSSVGVSVFWDTPIGPLRFNFSRPLRNQPWDRVQNFDLTIQARF